MNGWIREVIFERLHGKHIHIEPIIAVEDLSDIDAKRSISLYGKSIYELLFHIVFWLEYSVDLINGEDKDFKKGMDWETDQISWYFLLEKFTKGISNLELIVKNWDLDAKLRINEELETYVAAEVLGIIQHTSYHLGQIVYARRVLGLWPQRT